MEQLYQPHSLAIAFWVTVCVWVLISFWSGQTHKPKERNKHGRQSDLLVFFGAEVAMVVAFALKLFFSDAKLYSNPAFFWFGLSLVLGGTVLRQLAIKTLGKYHVMTIATQDKQPVITSGVYRYIRHPSYLGAIVAVTGIALSLNSLVGSLELVALTIMVLIHRIQFEGSYLSEHLGAAYKRYTNHTARLIPFVW